MSVLALWVAPCAWLLLSSDFTSPQYPCRVFLVLPHPTHTSLPWGAAVPCCPDEIVTISHQWLSSSTHRALGNCFDFLCSWGQISVATAISVALQPPFLAHYKEMLPLLSSSCWINPVVSGWPEVVRSYLSAWCFWGGCTQWHSGLQTFRRLNDSLSIRCRAVSSELSCLQDIMMNWAPVNWKY